MINKIGLVNFQAHKDSELDLDNGVNVIVGSSDKGKSSIIRALRWAINGKPTGDSMVRHGEKLCIVSIETEEGAVAKIRDGAKASYSIDNDNGNLELKASGQEVPSEVSDILNLGAVNIQGQHDSPFLLSASSGEVARTFNDAVDIGEIDQALANADKIIRGINADARRSAESLSELEQKIGDIGDLKPVETALQASEAAYEALATIEQEHTTLTGLVDSLIRAERRLNAIGDMDGALAAVNEALYAFTEYDKIENEKLRLGEAITLFSKKKEQAQHAEEQLTELEQRWHDEMPDVCPLCEQEIE